MSAELWNGVLNKDTGEKTWLTPRWIVEALGHFDTDPCCPPDMPWRTADRMLTKEDDGTTAPWVGRVWCNPPYGRESEPFLKRIALWGGGGCSLLFARTETRIWQQYIFPYAHAILFIAGRLRFCRADGSEGECATAPSAIVAYSPRDVEALEKSGIRGTIVRLKP